MRSSKVLRPATPRLRRSALALVALASCLLPLASTASASPYGGGVNCEGIMGIACIDQAIGLTNDSVIIQAKINAANSASGANQAEVYLPSGTYNIGTTLTIPASIKLRGAGLSTILKATSGLSGAMIANAANAGNLTISDVQLNGNQAVASSGTDCISLTGGTGSNIMLANVRATTCKRDGIRLSGVTRANLTAIVADTNQANGINVLGASLGVSIANTDVFDNNQTSGTGGIAVAGTSLGTAITNLYADDDQGGGATQLYPVAEGGSANKTFVTGMYAVHQVTANTASLSGASSRVNDLAVIGSNTNVYSGQQSYSGVFQINNTTGIAFADTSAPGGPGLGKTSIYTVSGLPHYVAGQAGADTTIPGTTGTLTNNACIIGGGTNQVSAQASGYGYTCSTAAVGLTTASNSVSGSDVALNNINNYFDGPSTNCGSACTTGTWCAMGQVTGLDTSGGFTLFAKLWDGTTVIDSGSQFSAGASDPVSVHLSGCLASPAGNIKISAKDAASTSGLIKFNNSGNSKDSTITVWRAG